MGSVTESRVQLVPTPGRSRFGWAPSILAALDELLKRSNLICDRIAYSGAQTVGDFRILLCLLLPKGTFRRDRSAIDGAQSGHEQGELPPLLESEGLRGCRRAAPAAISRLRACGPA